MNGQLLADAFGHHAWATLTLLDVCADLTPDQLESEVPGTFGSIIGTLRHLVAADTNYLGVLAPGAVTPVDDEDALGIAELRATMATCGDAWARFCAQEIDTTALLTRHRDDGSTSTAPATIRIAQVLHHGTDHRSQVCTALTNLGIEPPAIDVWDYADKDGRLAETPPTDGSAA